MARVKDRERATKLRMQGLSYSAISQELGINKSTLSGWLSRYPLSESRIRELRGSSPQRIERFRNTMLKKRNVRLERVYKRVVNDFKKKRFAHDLYAGFFLYWGEGTKAARYTTALTNSDPNMIRFFIQWLSMLGVKKKDLRLKLHLYADMDIKTAHLFWMRVLDVPKSSFNKAYVKNSLHADKTYKGLFGHGTCSVSYHDRAEESERTSIHGNFHDFVVLNSSILSYNANVMHCSKPERSAPCGRTHARVSMRPQSTG